MLTMFALSTQQTVGLVAVIAVLGIGAMATPMALMMREYERQGLITGPYDALRRVFRYRWLTDGISLPTARYKRVQREITEGVVSEQTVAAAFPTTTTMESSADAFVVTRSEPSTDPFVVTRNG